MNQVFRLRDCKTPLCSERICCQYNILFCPERSVTNRRCSVVVITPDFDVHLQNFPATGVRLSAEPEFLVFFYCAHIIFLFSYHFGRRVFKFITTTQFASWWGARRRRRAHLCQCFFILVANCLSQPQPSSRKHQIDVFCLKIQYLSRYFLFANLRGNIHI